MKYSKNDEGLSDEQRNFYEENGYVLIKNNVPIDLLDELIKHFKDCAEGRKEIPYPCMISKNPMLKERGEKGEKVVEKIQDFLYDDIFFKYASYPKVTDIVESIIGPNIIGVHSMLINKPPNCSSSDLSCHPLHQDLLYFPFRPADNIVASWTAMEHIDENNGCLYAFPGSHKTGKFHYHSYVSNEKKTFYYGIPGFENNKNFINFIMEKGDTIFFHPLLLHGSHPNKSKGFRKAISVHFADSFCHFIDSKGTQHDYMVEEFRSMFNADYNLFFKLKSRFIKGNQGTFRQVNKL